MRTQNRPTFAVQQRIDALCDALRMDWQCRSQGSIEKYLAQSEPEWRDRLLEELLHTEIEQRLRRGDAPQVSEYEQRLPDAKDIVSAVFAELPSVDALADRDRPSTCRLASPQASSRGLSEPSAAQAAVATLSPTETEPMPERIGRYRVERRLGRGGFGVVYLAMDEQLARQVAIKVPHPHLVSSPELTELYLSEARAVARLDHPHIGAVYDVGGNAQYPCFIVSRYVAGVTLAQAAKHASYTPRQVAELIAKIADALHYAHTHGVVHRDIKPGNILLDATSQPYVLDFGLALRDRHLLKGLRYAGTPSYMSPEQARGEGHHVDGRSDIFSLGVVLYELLTGVRPFWGSTESEILEMVTAVEPKPPRQINDRIPKDLERICLSALAKRLSDRYLTARDLSDDLHRYLQASQADSTTAALQPTGQCGPLPVQLSDGDSDTTASVVPKGLRSFDELDSEFFLSLLPGARDRHGLPESIRFWRSRIAEFDGDKTFAVGLLYGPSGCGKTSLLKAGLLPRLPDSIQVVFLEADGSGTEARLLKVIHKKMPEIPAAFALRDSFAFIRCGGALPAGRKLLVVIDQFEQWLQANQHEEGAELLQALRQCDGERVQCLLLVRDDFWLSISRFFRQLDVPLADGANSLMLDLFDLPHARRVLGYFGRAMARLPSRGEESPAQRQFLEQASQELAFDGRVVPVHLALFAEMMRNRPWSGGSLREVGGAIGLGVAFLEESFVLGTAPAAHRLHERSARRVLEALLPDEDLAIKRHSRSKTALLQVAGYQARPLEFEKLLTILRNKLRLIREVDSHTADDDERTSEASQRETHYQLTHDYLVPVVREWVHRRMGLVARFKLWRRQRPEAPALIAGAYVGTVTTAFSLWGLFGIAHFAFAFHEHPQRLRAIFEILAFIAAVFLPLVGSGIGTARGDLRSLWVGALLLTFHFGMSALACIGQGWEWFNLASMESLHSVDGRVQVYSLFSGILLIGCLLYLWAIVDRYTAGARPRGK